MDDLKIDKTIKTPGIKFSAEEGTLIISGRAIPENPEEFFIGVIQWVKDYFKDPKDLTTVSIQLEYINSGSSKYLLELLHMIEEMHKSGKLCEIKWYYEEDDEAVLELGKHYQSIIDVPFKLIEVY